MLKTDENKLLEQLMNYASDLAEVRKTERKSSDELQSIRQLLETLSEKSRKSEALLLNVLPEEIARRLKEHYGVIAESYPDATVLFADIVGFTAMSSKMSITQLLALLNDIFTAFDALVEKHGLEKIKTIGDAYMAVGGVPTATEDHPEAVAAMALDMLEAIKRFKRPDGEPIQIRIGINTGPLMAGVIGTKKFVFDLWGDTVNTASRMESHGLPGTIHTSTETYHRLHTKYEFEKRGLIHVKGKGEMATYYLLKSGKEGPGGQIVNVNRANPGLERAKDELTTFSLTDSVTGVHTRPAFVAFSQQQLLTATRENRKVLLLLIKLGDYQTLVEASGEKKGDRHLKKVAGILLDTFRKSDIIGRIAEDLFIVSGVEAGEANEDILEQRLSMVIYGKSDAAAVLHLRMAGTRWDPECAQSFKDVISGLEKRL